MLRLKGIVGILVSCAALVVLAASPVGAGAAPSQASVGNCDKTSISEGSGQAGEAHCQFSGFAPNETVDTTSNSPTFKNNSFNAGSGSGTTFIFSDCGDPPGPFTVTYTGRSSGQSASISLTIVANPSLCPGSTSPAPTPVPTQPHFTG